MRFLLDESADLRIVRHLEDQGHDVTGIVRDNPASLPDTDVLAIAYREKRTPITHDRDCGELVFVEHQPHASGILLRLGPFASLEMTIARLDLVFSRHMQELDRFIVVTPNRIRVRR